MKVAWWAMCALLFLGAPSVARAQQALPLWELGVVVGGGYLPDYPAAGKSSFRALPLPFFVYRGKVFRSEESGIVRGRIVYSPRVEFDISLAGALDVKSQDNRARAGMPDLDWMGQIGPRLQIVLAQAARDAHIDLELPVRAVISTDFRSFEHIGFVSVPEIAYQHENFLTAGTRLKAGLGFAFADRTFQEVIYGVPDAFATATRSDYDARGGYMGAKLSVGAATLVTPVLRLVGQLRVDFHHGAANEASPLFLRKTTGTVLFGAVWSIVHSVRTVVE